MDVHDHRQKIHLFGVLGGPQGGDLESLKSFMLKALGFVFRKYFFKSPHCI